MAAVFSGEDDALADAVIEGGRGRQLMDRDEIAKYMQLMAQLECPGTGNPLSHSLLGLDEFPFPIIGHLG